MKNITILGASSIYGRALTKGLLDEGKYRLSLVARHATYVYKDAPGIKVYDLDAEDINSLTDISKGQDAVFCAVSGDALPAVANAVAGAMKRVGMKRIIFMAAVGIYNEIPYEMDGKDNVYNNPNQIPNRDAAAIVENSGLDYTILRPGYLKDNLDGEMTVTRKGEAAKGYLTSIPALVRLCRAIIDDGLFIHQSISYTKDMTK